MNKKNKELIKTLYVERKRLYPNGCPFAPRGCGKTFLYLMHFLRYVSYDVVIDECRKTNREISLEEAHNDMKDYINEMWKLRENF